jgi:hypothetical protein
MDFLEQPWVMWATGITGSIVGTLFCAPILALLGLCIVVGFHKARVVSDKPTPFQVVAYLVLVAATVGSLYALHVKIQGKLRDQVALIAQAVYDKVTPAPSKYSSLTKKPPVQSESKLEPEPPAHIATKSVITANEAFAVAVETRIWVPGPSKNSAGTGFWALNSGPNGCSLSSIDVALFIRIKNLQSRKVMITAYNVFALGGQLQRFRPRFSQLFLILGHGVIKPHTGTSLPLQLPVPSGNAGMMVQFPFEEADPGEASPLIGDFLDTEIGEHYLEPGDSARGWAFFKYPTNGFVPASMRITVSDDLNHTFDYKIPDVQGNPSGDNLVRVLAYGATVNLSSCRKLIPSKENQPPRTSK